MILFLTPDTATVSRLTLAAELGEDDFAHIGMASLDLASRLRVGADDGPTTAAPVSTQPPPSPHRAAAVSTDTAPAPSANEPAPREGGEALAFIDEHDVEVVVVGPHVDARVGESLIGDISTHHPLLPIVAFALDTRSAFRAALRAGATEVATRSMPEDEIVAMLNRCLERNSQRQSIVAETAGPPQAPKGAVITVASPKGGVGRTLIATTTASLLHRACPGDVVLVDLHLQSGDVAPLLALTPDLSLESVAARGDEFDSADVKTLLAKTDDGLHVLAAPQSLTAAVKIGPATITRALELLRESFRYVVVDTGPTISDASLAAFDQTSHLVMITATDVPSVRALGRMTDALDELQVSEPDRFLVINRASDRYGMPQKDIEAVIGLPPTAVVAASRDVVMTMNMGESFNDLLNRRGTLTKGMTPFANTLLPKAEPKRPSLSWRGR